MKNSTLNMTSESVQEILFSTGEENKKKMKSKTQNKRKKIKNKKYINEIAQPKEHEMVDKALKQMRIKATKINEFRKKRNDLMNTLITIEKKILNDRKLEQNEKKLMNWLGVKTKD